MDADEHLSALVRYYVPESDCSWNCENAGEVSMEQP